MSSTLQEIAPTMTAPGGARIANARGRPAERHEGGKARRVRARLGRKLASRLACLVVTGAVAAALTGATTADATMTCQTGGPQATFATTGQEQCYIVPAGVTSVSVSVIARGHDPTITFASWGAAGTVDAYLPVTPGETLYVEVGGVGGEGGGAITGTNSTFGNASGGGASDVRTCSIAEPLYRCDSLHARMIVAGGGGGWGGAGGGGSAFTTAGGWGMAGGDGANGSAPSGEYAGVGGSGGGAATGGLGGGGGTATGGVDDGQPGGLGYGGAGGHWFTVASGNGNGGGGGYFGGGGGGAGDGQSAEGGGGGGGSSFVVNAATSVSFGASATGVPQVQISPGPADVSAPSIAIESPVAGQHYPQGQTVNAAYACTDEAGGSGVASCSGPVPLGALIDSSTAGVHSFTVSSVDHAGNTNSKTVAYTVDAPAAAVLGSSTGTLPGSSSATAPALTALSLSPSAFAAAAAGASIAKQTGTTIRYTDSKAATTNFTVRRALRGVKVGRRCLKPSRTRHGARCTRYAAVAGTFAHRDTAGPNRLRFSGRIAGHKLGVGTYQLNAVPRDAAGRSGKSTSRPFRITR